MLQLAGNIRTGVAVVALTLCAIKCTVHSSRNRVRYTDTETDSRCFIDFEIQAFLYFIFAMNKTKAKKESFSAIDLTF